MHLQFQTNELIEPPRAHAIELFCKIENKQLQVTFEITYINRETLDLEEIIDEGFSEDDDFKWSGVLPEVWVEALHNFQKSMSFQNKSEIEEFENYWQINFDERSGYPENEDISSDFLEGIKQAIFEEAGFEAPLCITILRKERETAEEIIFRASFTHRTFERGVGNHWKKYKWESLNPFLADFFNGDFRPEQASEKYPKRSGLYVNLGDGLWYELGKSYLIQPSKILQYLH